MQHGRQHRRQRSRAFGLAAAFGLLAAGAVAGPWAAGAARAHEFLVRPAATSVAAGQTAAFTVESTHVFMRSEEMEAADTVAVTLQQGGQTVPAALRENPAALRLDGEVTVPAGGSAWLLGHRLGQVWSTTPAGTQPGGRDRHPDAVRARLFEKFAKTLLNPDPSDTMFAQPVGHRLEIVPVTNPAAARVGEDVTVRVLYDGQPLATPVYATHDGFTDTPNSYAYVTETYGEGAESGLARVRITAPGLWMVRVQHTADAPQPGIDQHVMRAVLIFPVP